MYTPQGRSAGAVGGEDWAKSLEAGLKSSERPERKVRVEDVRYVCWVRQLRPPDRAFLHCMMTEGGRGRWEVRLFRRALQNCSCESSTGPTLPGKVSAAAVWEGVCWCDTASVSWEEGLSSEEPSPSDCPVGTTVGANPGQVVLGDVRKEDDHRASCWQTASLHGWCSAPAWAPLPIPRMDCHQAM